MAGRDIIVQAPSLDVGGSVSRAISDRTIFQVRLNDGAWEDGSVGRAAKAFPGEGVWWRQWYLGCILVLRGIL